jgi:hypothetical protein
MRIEINMQFAALLVCRVLSRLSGRKVVGSPGN